MCSEIRCVIWSDFGANMTNVTNCYNMSCDMCSGMCSVTYSDTCSGIDKRSNIGSDMCFAGFLTSVLTFVQAPGMTWVLTCALSDTSGDIWRIRRRWEGYEDEGGGPELR